MGHQAVQNVRVSQLPDSVSRQLRKGESIPVTSHGNQIAIIQPVSEPRQDIFQFLEEWRTNAPNLPDDPFGDVAELRHKSVSAV